MPEEPEQNTQSVSKAEQQAKPSTSTNAGAVVAWIGIVLCGINIAIYAIDIITQAVLYLIDCYEGSNDGLIYFIYAIARLILGVFPLICLISINAFKNLAKNGKWTAGACVAAVIVAIILCFVLTYVMAFIESYFTLSLLNQSDESAIGRIIASVTTIMNSMFGTDGIGGLISGLIVLLIFAFCAVLIDVGLFLLFSLLLGRIERRAKTSS